MSVSLEFPPLGFADAAAFHRWLAENHASSKGTWIKLAKVVVPDPCLRYAGAVEVALQWGWIDGQVRRLNEREYQQWFTPRRSGSLWSKINTEKATALIAAGKMEPPGLLEVEKAKADGRWTAAYLGSRESAEPDDLIAALAANPVAKEFFATLDGANRYAVLFRLQTARTAATRASRLEKLIGQLARRERFHGG